MTLSIHSLVLTRRRSDITSVANVAICALNRCAAQLAESLTLSGISASIDGSTVRTSAFNQRSEQGTSLYWPSACWLHTAWAQSQDAESAAYWGATRTALSFENWKPITIEVTLQQPIDRAHVADWYQKKSRLHTKASNARQKELDDAVTFQREKHDWQFASSKDTHSLGVCIW